ncbi:MAG: cyclopropane fatty acyl phospholipid synthase [Planctomycetota bacterium]|nr:cyclopropane fatty acyl phospholipid synthase [Planctomycetota bacterium]
MNGKQRLLFLLHEIDVHVGGNRPWDLDVHDERLYRRVARTGLIGLGDAYVDGWWDCPSIDCLFDRALRADVPSQFRFQPITMTRYLLERLLNRQNLWRSRENIHRHYDIGNELYESMLDARMTYSCGYWKHATTLNQAQEAKLDLVCKKLGLEPGMRVLDVGSGWGSFVKFAAEHYGCRVVGITLSSEQAEYSRRLCKLLPVEIRLQDYREVDEHFDRIASIGMLEHVGPKNYRAFMLMVRRCLGRDGLCLLHFLATKRSWPNLSDTEVLWLSRRIFPGGVFPSLAQIGHALDGLLVTEDLENFGSDYDRTLMAWHANFTRHWSSLKGGRYDERFYRMWTYYLLTCAGATRSRKYQVWQMVLSPQGVPGGYQRPEDSRGEMSVTEMVGFPQTYSEA